MATLKQMLANRRNAKNSCGPTSPETKAIVSRNATKHGLCGNFRVLDFEDQARYDDLLDQFVRDEKPVGSAEHELVVKMAVLRSVLANKWFGNSRFRGRYIISVACRAICCGRSAGLRGTNQT